MRRDAGGPVDGLARARRMHTEVCGRVRYYAWGLLGDSVGSRLCSTLGFCGAATEEALLGPVAHLGPGGLDG
ncbi:hypothetical protein NDU88_002463 [Pleurodeles waltl]|uniref:Uncharacterized protein n=1 Tax=Pleurodeles waltl TaxID=8319 RepID=A0AAV7VEZ0_PLEWA|nr:hypothetical protein NDU88_002463 [Pleurodeles waltl]